MTPEQMATINRELNRVFDLTPEDAFEELTQLHLQRQYADEEQDLRILYRIALLAEGLGKWWHEKGGRDLVQESEAWQDDTDETG